MPNNQNRRNNALSVFDTMSTEELQQILREDASKPEGEGSDMETILYVMEVLAKRRKEQNEGTSPEEALESFKSKYYTTNNSFISESRSKTRRQHKVIRWTRGLVAATVVLVLIIGSSFTARAMGFDLLEVIAKWTQDTFHFGYIGQDDNPDNLTPEFINPCTSLQETLNKYEFSSKVVPTWLPEGYCEVELIVNETPMQRRFSAIYQAGENTIRIRIVDYLSGIPTQIEQSDTLVEVYSTAGVNYYIFDNQGQLQAVWTVDSLECYISGPVNLSEIKSIIDSIGKG